VSYVVKNIRISIKLRDMQQQEDEKGKVSRSLGFVHDFMLLLSPGFSEEQALSLHPLFTSF
jgi:hypothetical protein